LYAYTHTHTSFKIPSSAISIKNSFLLKSPVSARLSAILWHAWKTLNEDCFLTKIQPKRCLVILNNYEKHVLLESSQIYYWIYKCSTCHHYTNIIKKGLIKLIKTMSWFTTVEGTSLILSVARDSAWCLA
jgi:hypothetical protein